MALLVGDLGPERQYVAIGPRGMNQCGAPADGGKGEWNHGAGARRGLKTGGLQLDIRRGADGVEDHIVHAVRRKARSDGIAMTIHLGLTAAGDARPLGVRRLDDGDGAVWVNLWRPRDGPTMHHQSAGR